MSDTPKQSRNMSHHHKRSRDITGRLLGWAHRNNVSEDEIATFLDVAPCTVRRWEAGQSYIHPGKWAEARSLMKTDVPEPAPVPTEPTAPTPEERLHSAVATPTGWHWRTVRELVDAKGIVRLTVNEQGEIIG